MLERFLQRLAWRAPEGGYYGGRWLALTLFGTTAMPKNRRYVLTWRGRRLAAWMPGIRYFRIGRWC